MDAALKHLVRQRADGRCEYCRLPQSGANVPFEIDHIRSRHHRGPTTAANLALACNGYKGPNISGLDPVTDKLTPLFNPRRTNAATISATKAGSSSAALPSAEPLSTSCESTSPTLSRYAKCSWKTDCSKSRITSTRENHDYMVLVSFHLRTRAGNSGWGNSARVNCSADSSPPAGPGWRKWPNAWACDTWPTWPDVRPNDSI